MVPCTSDAARLRSARPVTEERECPSSTKETGTRIDEIAPGIFRINTPLEHIPGGFSYNQYLIRDR